MTRLRSIRISAELSEFIRSLHPFKKRQVHKALQNIREYPGAGKPLKDELEGYRSYRVGNFRIIYLHAETGEIEIVAIGPRRNIYEETTLLLKKDMK